MAAVHIYSNDRDRSRLEWVGEGALDPRGALQRVERVPRMVHTAIESALARGRTEGIVFGAVGLRYKWTLDV
jgi:hypothetical protein